MFNDDCKEIICGYSSLKTLKNSILKACGSQNYKYYLNPKTCIVDLYKGTSKGNHISKNYQLQRSQIPCINKFTSFAL